MEKITKDFKGLSLFMIALALFQAHSVTVLLRSLTDEVILNNMANTDFASLGITAESLIPVVRIGTIIPSILTILVYIFLCFKGLKEAKDPSGAKFHIILAYIWAVLAAFSTIASVVMLVKGSADVVTTALDAGASLCSSLLLFYYAKYAKEIRNTHE